MSAFYTSMQTTVGKLIADKGQLVTLRRIDPSGAFNMDTETQPLAPVLFSASAVVLDFPIREIDGTTIIRGDRKVLIPASSAMPAPQVGDELDIGGVVHHVIHVKAINPAGTTVMYTLGARAGG